MVSPLSFLEGEQCDPHLEVEARFRYPSRPATRHVACQRELMSTRWGRRSWRVAALRGEHGELGAAVSVHDLHWRLGARRLRLAGVGSLSVAPRYRGLGLSRRLMHALHAWLREREIDGVLAFSTIGGNYFARMGYHPLPLAALEADLETWDSAGPEIEPESVVRAYRPTDFDAVRNLYNTTSSLQALAVLRDNLYWDFLLERERLVRELFPDEHRVFLVGERDGHVVSYMRAGLKRAGGTLCVFEYGAEPDAAADMTHLSREVIRSFGGQRPKRLRSVVPTRFRNWFPGERMAWRTEKRNVLMMRALTDFAVPAAESGQDERLIWAADRF